MKIEEDIFSWRLNFFNMNNENIVKKLYGSVSQPLVLEVPVDILKAFCPGNFSFEGVMSHW